MTDTYTYDVFGAIRSQTGGDSNYWLFTGEQHDADSDLYYLRTRYYDSETGRFLGEDPLRLGNRYSYVGNNPANYVDPSGLIVHGSFPKPPCISFVCGILGGGGRGQPGNLTADLGAVLTHIDSNPLGTLGYLGVVNLVAGLTVAGLSDCDDRTEKEGGIVHYENCSGGLANIISNQLLGGNTFTLGSSIFSRTEVDPQTLLHELCHPPQYNDLGALFLPLYGLYQITNDTNRLETAADDCAGTSFYR